MAEPVSPEHLVQEHGMDRRVVDRPRGEPRGSSAARHVSLFLQMQHATDHAQRKVGHEHT